MKCLLRKLFVNVRSYIQTILTVCSYVVTVSLCSPSAKKVLQDWMMQFAPLALTDFKGVRVFHDPSNGEKLEILFPSVWNLFPAGVHLFSPLVGE